MDLATVQDPPAIIWETRTTRPSHNPRPVKKKRSRKAALAVGMVIILSDGTRCQIVAFRSDGRPICHFER